MDPTFTGWERLPAANIAFAPCCHRLSRLDAVSTKVDTPATPRCLFVYRCRHSVWKSGCDTLTLIGVGLHEYWTLSLWFQVSGVSPAAGQKIGRSDRKRNFWGSAPKSAVVGFRNNSGKMKVGLSATKPNKAWSRLNPTYKMQSGPG
jgi:hypothetical protein